MEGGQHYSLILFISGMSVKSVRAMENLKEITDRHLKGRLTLRIIDINQEREKAAEYQIFAIPTLLRIEPAPLRTLIGDLSDSETVLRILDLN